MGGPRALRISVDDARKVADGEGVSLNQLMDSAAAKNDPALRDSTTQSPRPRSRSKASHHPSVALGLIALTLAVVPAWGQHVASTTPAPAMPSTAPGAPDPFAWLEDIHGARAEAWVKEQNAKTQARFAADPRFPEWLEEARSLFTDPDRPPEPDFLGDRLTNLWRTKANPKGIWRATTATSFRSAAPAWETLLDVDALSKAEGRNWVFLGADCLPPADRLCLIKLSDGGGDAIEVREFDTRAKTFVPNGFHLPASRQDVQWLDADTILIARDWGKGSLSASGYPLVVKTLKRGQALADAKEVFRGLPSDDATAPMVLRSPDGRVEHVLYNSTHSTFSIRHFLATRDGGARGLDLPEKSDISGYLDHRMIVTLNEAWPAGPGRPAFDAGDLITYEPVTGAAELIVRPSKTQTIDEAEVTSGHLLVSMLDNVNGAVDLYAPALGGWRIQHLALPVHSAIWLVAADPASERAYLTSEDFLTPTVLWELNAVSGTISPVKHMPARFDGSRDVIEQHYAVSSDKARIPYFVVRPRAMKFDGSNPTFMYGYGGFQASLGPSYSVDIGKLWLEHGGVFVLANIRGGGEYGPAWHEAAVREHRQLAFDDFAAIARDLITRRVTSPRRLGIWGASNGGLLAAVSIVQHPELFNAAVIQNPVIDMLHFSHLSTGSRWIGEFGDPDVRADRAFLVRYSPYQNLKPGVRYPEPFIETNAADDRVHPGHARKFAAALEALGNPVIYFEGDSGGHHGSVDADDGARRDARSFLYLAEKLMD